MLKAPLLQSSAPQQQSQDWVEWRSEFQKSSPIFLISGSCSGGEVVSLFSSIRVTSYLVWLDVQLLWEYVSSGQIGMKQRAMNWTIAHWFGIARPQLSVSSVFARSNWWTWNPLMLGLSLESRVRTRWLRCEMMWVSWMWPWQDSARQLVMQGPQGARLSHWVVNHCGKSWERVGGSGSCELCFFFNWWILYENGTPIWLRRLFSMGSRRA